MFLRLVEWLKQPSNLSVPHRGIVKDNNDPKKLGRVKCVIPDLIESPISTSDLPWIHPLTSYSNGGRVDIASFSVPEVDSELVVTFPYGDIYSGFYSGYWHSDNTRSGGIFDDDYPDSFGTLWSDGSKVSWYHINKSQKTIELFLSNGAYLSVNGSGDINILAAGNLNLKAGGNINVDAGGSFGVKSGGDIGFQTSGGFGVVAGSASGIDAGGVLALNGAPAALNSGPSASAIVAAVIGSLSGDISSAEGEKSTAGGKAGAVESAGAAVKSKLNGVT